MVLVDTISKKRYNKTMEVYIYEKEYTVFDSHDDDICFRIL